MTGPDNATSYLWDNGNVQQDQWAWCENGKPGYQSYYLTITDTLGCQWSDGIEIEFFEEPGYADLSEGESLLTLFPNPVEEFFFWRLECDKEVQMAIEIHDGAGNVHYRYKIDRYQPGRQLKVDARNLNPGVYYFSVISNGNRITKKFTKK